MKLINMKRDSFIRELYNLLPKDSQTAVTQFYSITEYIQWHDKHNSHLANQDYWNPSVIDDYMLYCSALCDKGGMKRTVWSSHTSVLRVLLNKLGKHKDATALPLISLDGEDPTPYKGLHPENELKPIAKLLIKAYRALERHFHDGTTPDIHPIYDEELSKQESLRLGQNKKEQAQQVGAFKQVLRTNPNNPISQIAMMITFMFTGMNLTPMANMKIRDVKFKSLQGGKYIFEADKARAQHLEIDNAMGFSKHAMSFISNWRDVALKMAGNNEDAPLFPYYDASNNPVSFADVHRSPQLTINKLLVRMGLERIGSSRFRKTKSDILMRVTQDVYLVGMSLNNTPKVVRAKYAHGLESDHEKSLSASMKAQFDIAKGEDVESSINKAKYDVADVLDDYDYKKLRANQNRANESRTPLGVRCQDNTKGSTNIIKKLLGKSGIDTNPNEEICTDFLSCFECGEHALVAGVDDIWLMLSFKDTLDDLKQAPSVNSLPKDKFMKMINTIEFIIGRFKDKAIGNFKLATELHKESAHPLYANVYSLNDLMEVF
ncbi:MAG: hypothetical protein CMN72_00345 [Sphingomonas sp.]|nr:hypothetical protein [Sphingomonas sp.]